MKSKPGSALFGILLFAGIGCESKDAAQSASNAAIEACRGIILERDSKGGPRFMNEYYNKWHKACVKDFVITPRWYTSEFKRSQKNIACTPQNRLASMTLKSSGNYYSYRDGKIYIELNAETGEFRRIIFGEDSEGNTIFERQIGCYFLREDFETEPVNPKDHGLQLYLDLPKSASSTLSTPPEIFKVNQSSTNHLELWRFDNNDDVDWDWCPTATPFEFCKELRNGNVLFFPRNLSVEVKEKLRAEALMIRSEYNFAKTKKMNLKTCG